MGTVLINLIVKFLCIIMKFVVSIILNRLLFYINKLNCKLNQSIIINHEDEKKIRLTP